MATNNIPFFRGRDVTLRFVSDGKPIYIEAKNFSWEQVAVEAADGVCGENRDRLDLVVNYYQGSVDVYQKDMAVLQALIDQQTNDDASATPFVQTGGVRIQNRDGNRAAYKMLEMKLGPWSQSVGSRTDPTMLNLKFRFTRFEKSQTI